VKDLREFIEAIDKTGDLVRIKQEVDWDLEAGAILRRVYETGGPAPLFEKIKDYPEGYRMFGGNISTYRRVAIALGLDPDTPIREIRNVYAQRLQSPIKSVVVKDGPCKENVITGDDVDLYRFPAPMLHEGDGGRYMWSWHAIIVKDPDSDWINWAMLRGHIVNKRTITGLCSRGGDMGSMFFNRYANKQPMPFATAIGMDPLSTMVAGTPIPAGQSEADFAGGLRKQPVEVIKCETSDILVPANAEIIIEGEILPDVRLLEGPFGEYPGYRTTPRMPQLVYRVKTITHRNNPILTMCSHGIPVDDGHILGSITYGHEIEKRLRSNGIPLTGCHMPAQMTGQNVVIVSTKTPYSNIATQIGDIASSLRFGLPHMVIVVNEDVDAYNMDEVLHAMATKLHPVRGIRVVDNTPASVLCPWLDFEDRKWGRGARVVFDCTWPLDWDKETTLPPRMSFREAYPEETQDKVVQNWTNYGFKELK